MLKNLTSRLAALVRPQLTALTNIARRLAAPAGEWEACNVKSVNWNFSLASA